MSTFKKAKVVMLFVSRNSGCLTQNRHTLRLNFGGSASTADNRHLYITSDDEIKEGDWCLYNNHIIKYNKPSNPHFFVYRVPISKGKADKRKCCFG